MKNSRTPVEFFLISYILHYYEGETLDRKLINSLIMKKREDKSLSPKNIIDKKTNK